jgi:hypothetical protein
VFVLDGRMMIVAGLSLGVKMISEERPPKSSFSARWRRSDRRYADGVRQLP